MPYFANYLGLLLWTVFIVDEAYNVLGWLITCGWSFGALLSGNLVNARVTTSLIILV